MMEAEILHTLTEIFCDIFDLPSVVLTPEMTAADVPGWDSVNHITLVVETERVFGIKFRTTEIEDLKNVDDLVRLIKAKSNK
jgi:acyl carrier protein